MTEVRNPDRYEFEDSPWRLGDELRGARASKGKSLTEVHKDLRIKSIYIDAIEHSDVSVFPSKAYIGGYVRAYARYLDLDPEEVLSRFIAETGVEISNAPKTAANSNKTQTSAESISGPFDKMALPKHKEKVGILPIVAFLVAIVALVGVGFGGWKILQNVQRVNVGTGTQEANTAPAQPETQTSTASSSDTATTNAVTDVQALAQPSADIYEADGALASIYAPKQSGNTLDGPIAHIDPDQIGYYGTQPAAQIETEASLVTATGVTDYSAGTELEADMLLTAPAPAEIAADPSEIAIDADPSQPSIPVVNVDGGLTLYATELSWVRIRDENNKTVYEATLQPGESHTLPVGQVGWLRSGNAGGVVIQYNGQIYGPLGSTGRVAKNVPMTVEHITTAYGLYTPAPLTEPATE